MKRVYLIRHAKPDLPQGQGMCLGSFDLPLGAEGRAQAKKMAGELPPVTAVFSSPLSRAADTAGALGQPVTVLPGLGELHQGRWDGLTFRQIRREFPALYEARGTDPSLLPPEAEPPEEGLVRFRAALEAAALAAPGDLAVVSHAGILSVFLKSLGAFEKKPDYCQIIPILWENGSFFPGSQA